MRLSFTIITLTLLFSTLSARAEKLDCTAFYATDFMTGIQGDRYYLNGNDGHVFGLNEVLTDDYKRIKIVKDASGAVTALVSDLLGNTYSTFSQRLRPGLYVFNTDNLSKYPVEISEYGVDVEEGVKLIIMCADLSLREEVE